MTLYLEIWIAYRYFKRHNKHRFNSLKELDNHAFRYVDDLLGDVFEEDDYEIRKIVG